MTDKKEIKDTVKRLLPEATSLLQDLIRIPSTSGQEHDVMQFLEKQLAGSGISAERQAMSDRLLKDPDYSDPVPNIRYDGRFNLRAVRKGTGGGKTLLFNTHLDVVPPSENMADPWSGREENGIIHGRGACDAKGQAATLYLVLKTLDTLKPQLRGDVIAHFVNEEENGGNGTLSMIRNCPEPSAKACIVMEPTDHNLYTSIRGAIWFRLTFAGTAGHSGTAGQTKSALLMAHEAMTILTKYHADLLKSSRGIPLFDPYPNPMPLTFGRLTAGNWPASAPSHAVLEGVLGLLPNKTKEAICSEFRQALKTGGSEAMANAFDLHFMYRHDSSVLDPEHELPQAILQAAETTGEKLAISGMTASCDAWFYNNQLNIPTVVYGPGTLKVAHSKDEQIAVPDMAKASELLVQMILNYCG